MKKTLLLAGLLAFTMSGAMANEDVQNCPCQKLSPRPPIENGKFQPPPRHEDAQNKKAEFEKKLKLTDEQKAQAKEIRQKGHEEMKPIFDKMNAKKQEIKKIKENTALSEEQKAQQLDRVKKDMRALHKEARDLRLKNMQEFESILTDKQKKTLEKMKKEGKKKFEQDRKKHQYQGPRPEPKPCQGDCGGEK